MFNKNLLGQSVIQPNSLEAASNLEKAWVAFGLVAYKMLLSSLVY